MTEAPSVHPASSMCAPEDEFQVTSLTLTKQQLNDRYLLQAEGIFDI